LRNKGFLIRERRVFECCADYTCGGFDVDALNLNSEQTFPPRNRLISHLTPRFEYCSVNH
jgi:hypothetical protein